MERRRQSERRSPAFCIDPWIISPSTDVVQSASRTDAALPGRSNPICPECDIKDICDWIDARLRRTLHHRVAEIQVHAFFECMHFEIADVVAAGEHIDTRPAPGSICETGKPSPELLAWPTVPLYGRDMPGRIMIRLVPCAISRGTDDRAIVVVRCRAGSCKTKGVPAGVRAWGQGPNPDMTCRFATRRLSHRPAWHMAASGSQRASRAMPCQQPHSIRLSAVHARRAPFHAVSRHACPPRAYRRSAEAQLARGDQVLEGENQGKSGNERKRVQAK